MSSTSAPLVLSTVGAVFAQLSVFLADAVQTPGSDSCTDCPANSFSDINYALFVDDTASNYARIHEVTHIYTHTYTIVSAPDLL